MWERPHTSFYREFHFFPPLLSGSAKQNFLPSHNLITPYIFDYNYAQPITWPLSFHRGSEIDYFSRSKISLNQRFLRNLERSQWRYSILERRRIGRRIRRMSRLATTSIFNVAINPRRGKISSLIFSPPPPFLLPIDNFWYYLSQSVVWLQ